jgi:MFS family permease
MDQNNDNKRTPLHLESALEPAATGGQHSSNSNDTSSLEFILSLFTTWWNDAMWPGLGLFGESYILFSLGLLKPFWATLYPDCFDDDETLCSTNLLNSITYSVVLGVICGMLLLGYAANRIGRRKGSILTASFMAGGSIGLSLSSFIFANNPKLLFQTMSVLLFVFGVGVGGEYPMSSSTATEKAMGEMNNRLKNELEREAQRSANRMHTSSCIDSTTFDPKTAMHHMYAQQQHDETNNSNNTTTKRGRAVQLVFLSQGTGIMANSLILVFLLLMFGQYGDNVAEVGYSPDALLAIWRIVYSIGAIVLIFVLVSRVAYLQESNVWTDDKGRRAKLNRTAVVEVEFEHLEQAPALAPSLSMVSSLSTPSTVMIGEASTMSDFMYSPPGNEKADVSATREYYDMLFYVDVQREPLSCLRN